MKRFQKRTVYIWNLSLAWENGSSLHVYLGRRVSAIGARENKLANVFKIPKGRAAAALTYQELCQFVTYMYFLYIMSRDDLLALVPFLKDAILGCFCVHAGRFMYCCNKEPWRILCHTDVIRCQLMMII